jgi:hypothetical protein
VHRIPIAAAAMLVGACGPAPPAGPQSKAITWAEFQTMDAEQQRDPYVTDNLDPDARKKLVESQKRKRR